MVKNLITFLLLLAFLDLPVSAGLAQSIRDYDGADHADLPKLLSGTGLYESMAARPRRSDGSAKERFVSVPPGTRITPTDSDNFDIPEKTVMIKNL